MKIDKIRDIEGFFSAVDHCKGRVELATGEGDRLNLKSKLSQYISLANIFSGDTVIPGLEILVSDPEELEALKPFITDSSDEE